MSRTRKSLRYSICALAILALQSMPNINLNVDLLQVYLLVMRRREGEKKKKGKRGEKGR